MKLKFRKRVINYLFTYELKDTQIYRRLVYQYLHVISNWPYLNSICSIRVMKTLKKTTLVIETHRPGLLIGKRGVFIDGLEKHINEGMGEEIRISIKESQIWYNLYKPL